MNNIPLPLLVNETIHHKEKKRSLIWTVFNNRCPHCREGKLFVRDNAYILKNNLKMHENCPVCKQPTEIEIGFYYGTSYVSYLVTVALSGLTFIAWWIFIGISVDDNRIFYWLGINTVVVILLQPLLMRFSRTLWLSWFVKYDADWKQKEVNQYERIVKEQMNNW
ncbi:MAG TPA: DUF983 domain-containing protein [Chitinophagaceae bacterium]